jgi:hypothetical protein
MEEAIQNPHFNKQRQEAQNMKCPAYIGRDPPAVAIGKPMCTQTQQKNC